MGLIRFDVVPCRVSPKSGKHTCKRCPACGNHMPKLATCKVCEGQGFVVDKPKEV